MMVPNDPQQIGEQVQVRSEEKFVVEKGIIRLRLIAIRAFSYLFTYLIYNAVSGPCERGGQHCPDNYYSILIVPATIGEKNIVKMWLLKPHSFKMEFVVNFAEHPYFTQLTTPFSLIGIFFLFFCLLQGVTDLAVKANKIMDNVRDSSQQQQLQSQTEPNVARDSLVPAARSTF